MWKSHGFRPALRTRKRSDKGFHGAKAVEAVFFAVRMGLVE